MAKEEETIRRLFKMELREFIEKELKSWIDKYINKAIKEGRIKVKNDRTNVL